MSDDWFWVGVYGRRHSQAYSHAFYNSLVHDQPPRLFDNYRLWAEHYAALRERALECPTAVGDTLTPKPAVSPAEGGYFTNFLRLPKATLPSDVWLPAKRPLFPLPPDAKFEITECLQVGPERFSQTFKARVVSPEVPEERFVVLKIYQESLGQTGLKSPPSPEDLEQMETWRSPGDTLRYSGATEAAAYQHLEVLHGSVLPWFYEAFDFDLPCGEAAFGLVLEYIDAPTMEKAAFEPSEYSQEWDTARIQRYQHLLRATLKAMYALSRCCVYQGDVGERNFLVHEAGNNTTAVIIDLGQASPACSSADGSSNMADTHSLFVQWGLDRKWCAEVADGLRLKIPGANWEPTGPVPQGDGSVFVRG